VTAEELKIRTRGFAVHVVHLVRTLHPTADARVIGRQLLRSGTGVGANYRAVCRPRSDADFVAKLGLVIEECDESAFWLELLMETDLVAPAATRGC
jgi:four helix bundle protein